MFSPAWPEGSILVFVLSYVQVLLCGVRGSAGGPGGSARRHQGGPVELLHVQPEGGVWPAGPAQRLALPPAALLRKEPRSRFCESYQFSFLSNHEGTCLPSLFDLIFGSGATFSGSAKGLPAHNGGEEEAHPCPVAV